jgi:transketolase
MPDPLYLGATELEGRAIRQIVGWAMDAPAAAKSGHSGTAMALAPLGVTLFNRVLRHDPLDPSWPDRDRFILSCGHASILQYSLAATFGYDLSVEDIKQFRQPHSRTPGHPEVGVTPTVEVTTGPLGQGIANGVGMAMAERILRASHGDDLVNHRTWVIAGDGCLEEGISHEAASLAGSLGLGRLCVIYDNNHITIDGPTELALHDDAAGRFRSYGWHVIDVGEAANDLDTIERALKESTLTEQPTLIMLRSHIGFPSPVMMDRKEAHGVPFTAEAITQVKEILGVPDEPFTVDDALTEALVAQCRQHEDRHHWEARLAAAGTRGHELLQQLERAGAPLPATFEPFDGPAVATRKSLAKALASLAPTGPGLVVGAADLTENTNALLPLTTTQSSTDHGGRQVHYGIRELAMGATMVGMAHHGGVRPVGGTFFVFSDYARPAIRLAALSHAGVLFAFTHDSIGVGEDGPTHQPIEQLMSLRAMPNLHVVRPGDANEAVRLINDSLTNPAMPATAVMLSRQDVALFDSSAHAASLAGATRGGYVVRDAPGAQFTLVATGSEVTTCLAAAELLAPLAVRVVAMPCWRCFDDQPGAYRDDVLRRDLPSLAVEAGATLGWTRYVDEAMGIDTFGQSAPVNYLFDYFNLTPQAVADHVRDRLELT